MSKGFTTEDLAMAATGTGTWIPTCTARECLAAADWRPVTKGELATGLASARDSAPEVAM